MSMMFTGNLYQQLRTRMLTFAPLTGSSVSSSLGERMYVVQAPDDATFPYGVMRIMNSQTNVNDGLGDRMEFDLEVMLYARPRSQQFTLEAVADVIQSSFLRYRNAPTDGGFIFSRQSQRDTIPMLTEPVDREVCTIMIRTHFQAWPAYLTQYSGSF